MSSPPAFEYDDRLLLELLAEVEGDLAGTGYAPEDVDALLDLATDTAPLGEDDVPPPPAEPVSRVGEVVVLGEHRLACGDARDADLVRLLMGEKQADCVVTDPPYGVSYTGRTRARLALENDAAAGLPGLLHDGFSVIDAHLGDGAPVYVFHPSGRQAPVFAHAFQEVGWQLRQTLMWVKDSMVLSHADYHYQHEPILYGFKPDAGGGRLGRGGRGWYGGNRQTSVFEVPRPRAAREHPTMKPPELIAALLRNSTRRGELVADPFAGSGSLVVACEQLGRHARMIELDPGYCDVIITRWERLTGQRAERVDR